MKPSVAANATVTFKATAPAFRRHTDAAGHRERQRAVRDEDADPGKQAIDGLHQSVGYPTVAAAGSNGLNAPVGKYPVTSAIRWVVPKLYKHTLPSTPIRAITALAIVSPAP